jgi:hypothetical protein
MSHNAKQGPVGKGAAPPRDLVDEKMNGPLPGGGDPGGAHSKGFSADPRPEQPVPDRDPVPLAPSPDVTTSQVRQHERDAGVKPTGRSEPGEYKENDRLMGSDR